jgi:hypothetical protein
LLDERGNGVHVGPRRLRAPGSLVHLIDRLDDGRVVIATSAPLQIRAAKVVEDLPVGVWAKFGDPRDEALGVCDSASLDPDFPRGRLVVFGELVVGDARDVPVDGTDHLTGGFEDHVADVGDSRLGALLIGVEPADDVADGRPTRQRRTPLVYSVGLLLLVRPPLQGVSMAPLRGVLIPPGLGVSMAPV